MSEQDFKDDQRRVAAPYVAFQTVKTLIGMLKEHGVPNRIDRSVLSTFSGGVQNQLMSALRFLELMDGENRPSSSLQMLVDALGTDQWGPTLTGVLKSAYAELFKLQMATASPSEFNDAFRKAYPCEGETLRKGLTFFLNAGRDAGIPISPYIMKSKKPRSAPGVRKKQPRPGGSPAKEDASKQSESVDNPPEKTKPAGAGDAGFRKDLLDKFPTFDPSWSDEVKAAWFKGFESFMAMTAKQNGD